MANDKKLLTKDMRFNINFANQNILEPIGTLWMEPVGALQWDRFSDTIIQILHSQTALIINASSNGI